jgi:glycogen debranching enzyme
MVLVAGRAFCISTSSGDFGAEPAHGFFIGDHRVLSHLCTLFDGEAMEPLAEEHLGTGWLRIIGRTRPTVGRTSLTVLRERRIASGLYDELVVHNYGAEARDVVIETSVGADFAELFAVKEHRAFGPQFRPHARAGGVEFRCDGSVIGVEATGSDVDVDAATMTWSAHIPARSSWRGQISAAVVSERLLPVPPWVAAGSRHEPAEPTAFTPADGLQCRSSHPDLDRAVRRSVADLDALRLPDPEGRRRTVIAAGAPWFMTLFGRDSLLTSWMALPLDPQLALGVLDALARRQGATVDPMRDEEPGRILHEVRVTTTPTAELDDGDVYYGSVDATPLFVMLLDELDRWGELPASDRARLLDHADRALQWIDEYGDRDGDGFVEYLRARPTGLHNQGWKDSWDGVRHLDGRVAESPIALCEVQAYVFGAWRARAALARRVGDETGARAWQARADDLRDRFDAAFWCGDIGGYAFGLDATKAIIDGPASNMGHVLWSGLARDERAEQVAATLTDDALWSGWGIRTLSDRCAAFDPLSYHCGSVWPHDNALIASGLARYGHRDEANLVIRAQLEAAAHFDGAMPELFAGFRRSEVGVPVRYPTSCSPQAWSAAASLAHLRTLLGLELDEAGTPTLDPMIPDDFGTIRLDNVRIAGGVAAIVASGTEGEITMRAPRSVRD